VKSQALPDETAQNETAKIVECVASMKSLETRVANMDEDAFGISIACVSAAVAEGTGERNSRLRLNCLLDISIRA
jgi:hypothetical protein